MKTVEPKDSGHDHGNDKGLLSRDNSMFSYGTCNDEESTMDTPSRKYRFRLWTVTCSCLVAIQTWFIYGYAIGYTAPLLNDLGSVNTTYTSLRKTSYQDIFSVSI